MWSSLKDQFINRVLPMALAIFIVFYILGIIYISIPRDINTYIKDGYKIVYQNTNPITDVTHLTLAKDKQLRFCTAYVSFDGKTMSQSECKRDE